MEEPFKKIEIVENINYSTLTNCINKNELSDGDVLQLNTEDYNNFINSPLFSFTHYLKEPFYLDEVLIEPADIKQNRILIIVTSNPSQPISEDIYPRFSVIYRCGWCGNVVAEDGSLLTIRTRNQMIKTIEKFKNIKMLSVGGACCPDEDRTMTDLQFQARDLNRILQGIYRENKKYPNNWKKENVYDINVEYFKKIQEKSLSEIYDDDLVFLGFERVLHKDFMFLYGYQDFDNIKKYVTFNLEKDKYEMRGHNLSKEKDINSTQQLIDNFLINWKLKINI